MSVKIFNLTMVSRESEHDKVGITVANWDEFREILRHAECSSVDLFFQALAYQLENGWSAVPDGTVALFDNPFAITEASPDDDGKLSTMRAMYVYTDYAIRDPLEELTRCGIIFLDRVDFDPPTGDAWATSTECHVVIPGGYLIFPAAPALCTYVRFVDDNGHETAYYHMGEWQEAPAGVMGAIMGNIYSGPDNLLS